MCKALYVPPRDSGERTPRSGNSSAIMTEESPNCSPISKTFPPAPGMRRRTSAPSARTYQSAASAAPRTTMWAVMVGTAGSYGGVIKAFLDTPRAARREAGKGGDHRLALTGPGDRGLDRRAYSPNDGVK